jgi:alanyl-tRNA synthetase
MALFGEKYGNDVRVVRMGEKNAPASLEFCGGTHVSNTAKIGLFHIVSETSVAAGVRRIEGATGYNLLEIIDSVEKTVKSTAQTLKSSPADIAQRAVSIVSELRSKDRVIEALNGKIAESQISSLMNEVKEVGCFKVVTALFKGERADALRLMTDRVKESEPTAIIVLADVSGGKLNFVAACGKDAVLHGAHAGNIIKEVAKIAGGSGGGRPESAMAGGKDIEKANEAISSVENIIASMQK